MFAIKQKIENAVYTVIVTLLCYNALEGFQELLFDPAPVGLSTLEKAGRIALLPVSFGLAVLGLAAVCFMVCLIPTLVFYYVDQDFGDSLHTALYTSIAGAIITITVCVIMHLFR